MITLEQERFSTVVRMIPCAICGRPIPASQYSCNTTGCAPTRWPFHRWWLLPDGTVVWAL